MQLYGLLRPPRVVSATCEPTQGGCHVRRMVDLQLVFLNRECSSILFFGLCLPPCPFSEVPEIVEIAYHVRVVDIQRFLFSNRNGSS